MTTRVLDRSEWSKVSHLMHLDAVLESIAPEAATVFVAEDGDHIVGAWALLTIAHVEGLWIEPSHRKRGRVLLRLWNQLLELARSRGIGCVWTGSASDDVAAMLTARGAHRLPDMYALPLRAGRS